MTKTDGGDLQKKYDALNAQFKRSEAQAKEVRDRIASVEDVAEAFLPGALSRPLLFVFNAVLSLAVITLLFAAIYKVLPDGSEARDDDKPDYERFQGAFSLGGPIVRDRLQFFGSYERNDQDRAASVFRGPQYDQAPANVRARLDPYQVGNLVSPFASNLYFGKVTWQPRVSDRMDVSYSGRDESEERGFGGTRVFEGAEDFRVAASPPAIVDQEPHGNAVIADAGVAAAAVRDLGDARFHVVCLTIRPLYYLPDGRIRLGRRLEHRSAFHAASRRG